ncbi:MAG: dihydropteroate synthase [Candidatus Hodarchaeales archaeon]|jgi:dihydropteroate synthase
MKLITGKLGKIEVGDHFPVRLVGIVNLSPESFYKQNTTAKGLEQIIRTHLDEKADILDLGGQSTAPVQIYGSSARVSVEKELKRVQKAFKLISDIDLSSCELSIDTQQATVAEYALNKGASIVNDISGLKTDERMAKVVADHDGSLIIMATKKKPGDVTSISTIISALHESLQIASLAEISLEQIAIDPGIGSWEGRPFWHDFEILNQLEHLRELKRPIYVGVSRKSLVGATLDKPPEDRLAGSLAATGIAVYNGAHILRTHDVGTTLDAVRIAEKLREARTKLR